MAPIAAVAQGSPQDPVPIINIGGNYMDAQFARLDFAQKMLEEQQRDMENRQREKKKLLDSGLVSALDLEAPSYAVSEFDRATSLLQRHKSAEAIPHLEKAIKTYPPFVSAHNDLGLAYLDLQDNNKARAEFEAAEKLDLKFVSSYLNLGRLLLAEKEYASAKTELEKAAALAPRDVNLLTTLAYAQHGAGEYHHAIGTSERVHQLDHKNLANIHYVAASSAIALKDFDTVERELSLFLKEDPSNPLAPSARQNLKILADNRAAAAANDAFRPVSSTSGTQQQEVRTFPNSDALKRALAGLGDEEEDCRDCAPVGGGSISANLIASAPSPDSGASRGAWKIRTVVDEVAVFFSATSGGKLVNDLNQTELTIQDNHLAPEKLIEFAPQSKLPLRLGLLIDTSGSLQQRLSFEKKAAAAFLEQILSNPADLAFVAGFSNAPQVTQDFTHDSKMLGDGVHQLSISGGTAIWDAVSFACWKLAAYPDRERVAKVLVVLTDGEDNASGVSLRQAIRDAEDTGVTVYTISTKDYGELRRDGFTDADKVLQALSDRTGGEAFFPGEMNTLSKSFERLRNVIRSRYLIAYRPANFEANGKFRPIQIAANRNGARLKMHARKGYFAPLDRPVH